MSVVMQSKGIYVRGDAIKGNEYDIGPRPIHII